MPQRYEPGTTLLGKYQLIEVAGRGGMATVWRSSLRGDAGFARPVAIKTMLPGLWSNASFASMFVEEARVVSSLLHPNVVQVLDFCLDEAGQPFIVMEWVEGLDLGRWILAHANRRKRTPWPLVVAIAADVLRALDAAHRRGANKGEVRPIFHRDVTPSNILLGHHGCVKLGDFGLARAMDRSTLTVPGVVKGKLAYVAPEMVAGVRASAGSDLYSLGVVLWEALAGRRLYEGLDDLALYARVGRGIAPPIHHHRDDLPLALSTALERLLASRPDARFATAREARDKLLGVLSEPVICDDLAASLHELAGTGSG